MQNQRSLTVSLLAVATFGCGGELPSQNTGESPTDPTYLELGEAPDREPVGIQEEADYVVQLGEHEKLSFMVDDTDGSVGVLGEVTSGGSILDELALMDASPAVIFHAVSTDPVPAELLDLHDRLVIEGEVEDFAIETAGMQPGWMRGVSLSGSSPCLNSTFNTNHCAHSSYQAHLCKFNSSGNWEWNVTEAHRYKAGFCVQQGTSRSVLTYNSGSDCLYFLDYNVIWGQQLYPYSETLYSATTYLTYVWWKPSGANYRKFRFTGGNSTGDVFDWGQRWSRTTSCD